MMKRKLVCIFAVMATLFILASSTTPTVAVANYKAVGVKAGDIAVYSYKTNMGGAVDQIATSTTYILGVSGTQISFLRNYNYANGSYYGSDSYTENVSQYGGGFHVWLRLLPANLSVGDPIQVGSPYKVNQTFTATFAGVQRTVNNVTFMSAGISCGKEYDKETGLFLRSNLYLGSNQWENMTLLSTTAWSAPVSQPTNLLIVGLGAGAIGGLVIGVVIGFAIKRRK
jgi:hypothetical protein